LKARKRHVVTDTQGSLLALLVHAADIQDSYGAVPLLKVLRKTFRKLRRIFRASRGRCILLPPPNPRPRKRVLGRRNTLAARRAGWAEW